MNNFVTIAIFTKIFFQPIKDATFVAFKLHIIYNQYIFLLPQQTLLIII